MTKVARRVGLALAASVGLLASLTAPAAYAAPEIQVQCENKGTNFYRCDFSGTVTEAVTEFSLDTADGTFVVLGEYPMASGHGSIEFTQDKVIVRFDEEYARTHIDLKFTGFTDVRLDTWANPGPYWIEINGQRIPLDGEGYCDEECRRRPTEGIYKNMWDYHNGNVHGQVVLGKSEATAVLNQEVTVVEYPGEGLESCVFTQVQVQDANDGMIWHDAPFTGEGTDTAKFTVGQPQAHRALVDCKPVPGASNVTNKAVMHGQEVEAQWVRKNAGADGNGTTPTPTPTPTPKAPAPTPTPTPTEKAPTPTPTPTPTEKKPDKPGLPKTGD